MYHSFCLSLQSKARDDCAPSVFYLVCSTMEPRHDLFRHLKLALQRATGHRGEVEIVPNLRVNGNYHPGTTDIKINEDVLVRPDDLCHVMVHEYGHYGAYRAFDRIRRKQSDLAVISTQARRRVLTALWPRLNARPLSLRYYQQVRSGGRDRQARGAEFPAEIIAAYLMAHVVPPYIAEEAGLKVNIDVWPRLPEMLWTESYGCSRLCPSGSKLLAAMQREVESLVLVDDLAAVAA